MTTCFNRCQAAVLAEGLRTITGHASALVSIVARQLLDFTAHHTGIATSAGETEYSACSVLIH
jgi:hypothetical protein